MDAVLVAFIAGYIFAGWRTGFLRRLIGLAFLAGSFILGAYLRYPIGASASTYFKSIPASYADLVGYTIAFPVILAAAHILTRPLLKDVATSGLSKEADRALGAVFGGVEAVLIISAVIVIFDTYFGPKSASTTFAGLPYLKQLGTSLLGSTTAGLLKATTVPLVLTVLGPVLPREMSSLVNGGLGGLPSGLPTGLPSGLPGLPFSSPKP